MPMYRAVAGDARQWSPAFIRLARGPLFYYALLTVVGSLIVYQFNVLFTDSFPPHCGPGVDSASNRNEYQES
jgi:hypothetical protein